MDRKEREEIISSCTTCLSVFDRIWACGGPHSQMTHYHRTGEVENCVDLFYDWYKCMIAKNKVGEERNNVIKSMSIYKDRIKQYDLKGIDILNDNVFENAKGNNDEELVIGTTVVDNEIWELKKIPSWTK